MAAPTSPMSPFSLSKYAGRFCTPLVKTVLTKASTISGFTAELPLGIRLMGGAVLCISPDIAYSGQATLVKVNSTSNVSDHIASTTAISWAVTPSIDLRYLASKKISVVAAFGFFFCLPKFNATETDANGNTSSPRFVCPTSIVTATAGIGYKI